MRLLSLLYHIRSIQAAEVLFSALGNQTVQIGSVSRAK